MAKEVLEIIQRGSYVAPSGQIVDVRAAIDRAVAGTVLYRPDDFAGPPHAGVPGAPPAAVEITEETTGAAGRRLVEVEGVERVVALNFASAKNPGGGFLGGAKAQEEDLAIASALYACLITQPVYYQTHRASRSMLYTDHMIYSPDVPFFRGEDGRLLESPFLLSIITSAAPNAGEVARHHDDEATQIDDTLRRRGARVLELAKRQGHRCLVLGAWGCGVFRNIPEQVAEAFAPVTGEEFRGAFDRVVFAVYDTKQGQPNLRAFTWQFGRRVG